MFGQHGLDNTGSRARFVYVRRAYRNGRIKHPKTDGSQRAVPLQAVALRALDALPRHDGSTLVFNAACGGYIDLHNFRNRDWKPAQRDLGIDPIRRIYEYADVFVAGEGIRSPRSAESRGAGAWRR